MFYPKYTTWRKRHERCEGFHLEGWKFVAAKLLFQKWQNQYHPRSLSLLWSSLAKVDCLWVTYVLQGEKERNVDTKWCNDKEIQYVLDLPCTIMYQQYKASNNSSVHIKHHNDKSLETVMMVTKTMSFLLVTGVCMLVRSMCLPSTHVEKSTFENI